MGLLVQSGSTKADINFLDCAAIVANDFEQFSKDTKSTNIKLGASRKAQLHVQPKVQLINYLNKSNLFQLLTRLASLATPTDNADDQK